MHRFPNRHLLIAPTVVAPSSVLRLPLNASPQDIRKSEHGIPSSLLDVYVGIYQVTGKRVARPDNLILTEHAPYRFRRESSQLMIEIIRIRQDGTIIVGNLVEEEPVDGLYSRAK